MDDETARWTRVGQRITTRMLELNMNQTALADRAGLSTEAIRPLVTGKPNTRKPITRAKVCTALGWTVDSIDRILAGAEPAMEPVPAEPADELTAIRQEMQAVQAGLQSIREGMSSFESRLTFLERQRTPGGTRRATGRGGA